MTGAKEADGAWLKVGTYRRSTLDKLSRDAEWAWFRLQLHSAEDDNRGRTAERDLLAALARKVSKSKAEQLLGELVEYGLLEWVAQGTVVEDIDRDRATPHTLAANCWILPRFQQENPPAATWNDHVERSRWQRLKALHRDGELCRRIKTRDRNQCRYCGVRVDWSDRNGPTGGTYDHVDPDGDNSELNVVVACRQCNGRKRDRTPDQWVAAGPGGLTLKRPGTTCEQAIAIDAAHGKGSGAAASVVELG